MDVKRFWPLYFNYVYVITPFHFSLEKIQPIVCVKEKHVPRHAHEKCS